jgi:predicted RNA-binding protein YlqC (UPF0109 family)
VRHRRNTGGIDSIHLLDQPEYLRKATGIGLGLSIIHFQARQMCNLGHLISTQGHFVTAIREEVRKLS